MKFEKIMSDLQSKVENMNLNDFGIINYNGGGMLLLAGSFDFSYYHEIEVIFGGVSFICCPASNFSIDKIRIANEKEAVNLNKMYDIDNSGYIVAIDDELANTAYYIVCEEITYNIQTVKYYDELGQRIKDRDKKISQWAKEKMSI
ncbi:hypothetical protein HNQ56_000856 [Anaerotaenia torta]|uniref:hypothetical protein n=1 Tax=Anaerotaenia torta TaxID=433293 RepID=UPI003D238C6C